MLYWTGVIAGIFVGICLCIAVLSLFSGCTDVTTPSLDVEEPVLLDVSLPVTEHGEYFPGGWCLEVCLVTLGAYYHQYTPTHKDVYACREEFKRSASILSYYKTYWELQASFRRWQLPSIYRHIQTGYPLIALIDGWKDSLHAVIVIGIDEGFVYYLCPMRGMQTVLHEDWEKLHRIGDYGVWRIKG
jgi:hypothetical protein